MEVSARNSPKEHEMALTRDEITAGATYAVRFEYGSLSSKRFADAVKLVKDIGTRPETTSVYVASDKTWLVELPADSVGGLSDLRTLAYTYNATVERA
jgi:hypothetical protein